MLFIDSETLHKQRTDHVAFPLFFNIELENQI